MPYNYLIINKDHFEFLEVVFWVTQNLILKKTSKNQNRALIVLKSHLDLRSIKSKWDFDNEVNLSKG
jgi:hypothetical protein